MDLVKYCFSYCIKNCQLLTIYLCIMWQALLLKYCSILFNYSHTFLLFTLFYTLRVYILTSHVNAPITGHQVWNYNSTSGQF